VQDSMIRWRRMQRLPSLSESEADKLRKTKPFDPVQQKFCDEDMENRMRACQDALTTEIKLRGEEVQPLSYRGNISNSYDLLSHQVKDPELLELINSADEARNARFKHRRAFEERVKRDAEQQQDRVARMKPGQVAHERFVTAMDRGFAPELRQRNEDFAPCPACFLADTHKGPNKKFAPRTKPGRTPWEKVVYCSRSCQRAHWKSHKLDCVKLAQVLAKRAEGDVAGFLRWVERLLRQPKALPFSSGGPAEIYGSAAPCARKRLECAGRSFLETLERQMPSFQPAPAEAQAKVPKEEPDMRRSPARGPSAPYLQRCQERAELRSKLRPGRKPLPLRLKGVELYALLEIQVEEDQLPKEEEVKEAYKRLVLIHHPDKQASKTLPFQLIQEAYEYLSDRENKQVYDSTLPFNDSIPTEAEIRRRGFFKALEPAFRRNARWSERGGGPPLGTPDQPLDQVHGFYQWWYDFESWRDVSPSYLEQQGLELEDVTNCPRQQRRTRQKQNEQIRKAFDVHERLRVMRLVDLAFRHDPRLLWERNAAAGDESRTRAPQKKTSAPRSPQRRKEPSEEELRKQEETKRVAKSRRQQLRKLVESLGLLVSGVELERFCLKATDTEELEDLAEEVGRLAQLPPEDVTEELTETDEEDSKSKKKEEAVVPDCTFCHGTGMNAVSKTACMFCDGSGKQHVEEAPAEEVEEAPPKEKRYRRKTPLQLAQEAVFDAMWASGMRPTETRHSPELRQERRERQEREREERRRLRELRQKEEREREQQLRAEQAKEEETIEEQFARRAAAREARAAEEEAKAEPEQNEPEEELDEDPRLVAEAERFLSQDQDTNPETVDRISKLTEFARLGIEGATQVILASLGASKELRECLAELEERRFEQPEEYTNEVLLLLSECVAPFFGLGTRPVKAVKLPALLRNRAKRVRQALRDLVLGCNFLAILEGQN
ncbi:unnamed protein product, partial [Effrenium voratum]